jgi:acyl transferase domain-containing protein/acyl carrier protein
MTTNKNDIAIIGLAGRFPEASDYLEFYKNLRSGKDSVKPMSQERVKNSGSYDKDYQHGGYMENIGFFDHDFFNISFGEAIHMAPEQRILLEVVQEAIEDSGYHPDNFNGSKTSLFVSDTDLDYYKLAKEFDPTLYTGNISSIIAGRISRFFNLRGAAAMVDTACSSSLMAIHLACNDLLTGNSDYAFACGCKLALFPLEKKDIIDIGISSPTGKARAFSDNADGTIGGEGFGCVILKLLDKAIEDKDNIHAVIKATAANQDGKLSGSLTAPDSIAQSEVIVECWKKAGIEPDQISYIETHGTGTKLGDPIEVGGIDLAFRKFTEKKNFCAISSVKTNIGHADSAAGIASLIKAVLSIKYAELFPSLHYDKPNSLIPFEGSSVYVNKTLTPWPVTHKRIAGVSSFGLMGTNCHAVLEEAPAIDSKTAGGPRLITLSAKNPASLEENIKTLRDYLIKEDASLANISYTLTHGRRHHNYRYAFVASDKEEMLGLLSAKTGETFSKIANDKIKVFVVFSAKQSVTKDLIVKLCGLYPDFQKHYNDCKHTSGFDGDHEGCRAFAFQYAFFNTLMEYGLNDPYLIGDGEGKLAIAAIKKQSTLEQAIEKVIRFSSEETRSLESRIDLLLEKEVKDQNVLFAEAGPEGNVSRELARRSSKNTRIKTISLDPSVSDPLLNFLKQIYLAGSDINWKNLWKREEPVKISLPAYKFKRTLCWLENDSENEAKADAIENNFYQLKWTKIPVEKNIQEMSGKKVLVFADESGLGDAILNNLKDKNQCIKVTGENQFRANDQDSYSVNAGNESDYISLFSELEKNNRLPDVIIHLWNYRNNGFFSGKEKNLFSGIHSQFFLLKHFHRLLVNKKTNIVFITSNAHKILSSDPVPNPVHGMSESVLNALIADNRKTEICAIDLDYNGYFPKRLPGAIISHILDPGQVRFCAYRRENWFMKMLEPVRINSSVKQTPVFKQDGTYLVTGGANGIGYEICKHISLTKCNIIIIGRSELTPIIQNKLELLKKTGSKVYYYSSDISDRNKLAGVFSSVSETFSKLDGIIHSAGIAGERTSFEQISLDDLTKVMAPKVQGTVYLDELSKHLDPEFFVMFSTMNTFIAQKETMHYTMANAFLDAYPSYKGSNSRYVTINWPGWKETGMSATDNAAENNYVLKPLTNNEGINALIRVVNSGLGNVGIIDADLSAIKENPYFLIDFSGEKDAGLPAESNVPATGNGTIKEKVAAIWYSVLKSETINDDDDFFDLGGHSLNGSQVINKIKAELNIEIEFDHLLDYSTINSLSAYLETLIPVINDPYSGILPAPVQEHYELSHSQKRFWILNAISNPSVFNTPSVYRIKGKIDFETWNNALNALVNRHESLRTVFIEVNGEPRQKIKTLSPGELKFSSAQIPGEFKTEKELRAFIDREVRKPFDLEKDLLIRADLFSVKEEEYIFIINLHHIVTDGVSTDVIIHDFLSLYQSFAKGIASSLLPLPVQYKDFAVWQNNILGNKSSNVHQAYWKEQFKGNIPVIIIAPDSERPAVNTFEGCMYNADLEKNLSEGLRSFSKENECTLFMTFMAAYKALLYCYSGQTDLIVGTPVAGRENSLLENQVGLYINFLPLRTIIEENDDLKQLLKKFKRVALDGFQHQVYPFDKLVEDLGLGLKEGRNYLYDIGFTFHMDREDPLKQNSLMDHLSIEEIRIESGFVKTDMWMNVLDRGNRIDISLEYNVSLYKNDFIENFTELYKFILGKMISNADVKLGALREEFKIQQSLIRKAHYDKLMEKKKSSWNAFKN